MTPEIEAKVKRQHHRAMGLCDRAIAARSKRDFNGASKLFRDAFLQEREAARLLSGDPGLEPSRSVLLRSAASLALECDEFREAERLVATALSGEPPEEIAEELRDILEQASLGRHLSIRGLKLHYDEMQLSIDGNATGHGMAESGEFIGRVQTSEKLLLRTIERKLGRPFREAGKAVKEITEGAELYLSVPRAASFAVTLRIGLPSKQLGLPNMDQEVLAEPDKIIDDLFDCLDSFQQKDTDKLRELIPDDTYRRNFVALAEQLGPDGDRVRVVGLTTVRNERERRVALVRRRPEERAPRKNTSEEITVTGMLLFANSTRAARHEIKVIDKNGKGHKFRVPDGMMADIVKPLYEEQVLVIGSKRGSTVRLQRIEKAPSDD